MINMNSLNNINNITTNNASLIQTNNVAQVTLNNTFKTLLENESKKLNGTTDKTYNLEEIFKEASEKYNISSDLLKAIAYNESHFKSDAVSSAGAVGIMQLMPRIAKALGVEDSYDPYQNIMGGAKLLSQLSDMYDGDITLMIAAYNAGCGNVAKYGGVPPFKETQNHIRKVMDTLKNGIDAPDISVKIKGTSDLSNLLSNSKSDEYNVDKLFTYDEYELLLEYYTKMLEIISSINSDDDDNISEDNSLADLFKLSYKQQLTTNLKASAKQATALYKNQLNYDL